MDNKLLELLQEKPIVVPKIIFNKYKKLNITEEELILLIYMINVGNKVTYNPELFSNELDINKYKAMELINSLFEKQIINIIVEKNQYNKTEEYIVFDLLYNKLIKEIIGIEDKKEEIGNDIFTIFEQELGRTISPMEYDMIKTWVTDYNKEIVVEALKEAVYNGVNSFRYIDKILSEWNKKGLKTKDDVIKDKNNYRNKKKENVEYFEYNWLEDE